MKPQFKRKNYFIKKTFQGRFILQFYLLVIFGSLIFTAIFSYATMDTLTVTYNNYNLKLDRTPFMLFQQILTTNWILFIPVGLFVVIAAIFQTHRIAGPLYKIEMVLDEMKKGVIDQNLFLRPKDDAKEIITKLNEYNKILADKVVKMRGLSQVIANKLDKSTKESSSDNNVTSTDLQEAQASITELKAILNEFTLKE